MSRTEELRALGMRRVVHIADGQRTREYVPAEDYDALAARAEKLRAASAGLVGVSDPAELRDMEAAMRLLPAPAEDKAASIDAIHALIAYAEGGGFKQQQRVPLRPVTDADVDALTSAALEHAGLYAIGVSVERVRKLVREVVEIDRSRLARSCA